MRCCDDVDPLEEGREGTYDVLAERADYVEEVLAWTWRSSGAVNKLVFR